MSTGPTPSEGDRTAVNAPSAPDSRAGLTEVSGPTDATVVRGPAAAPTLADAAPGQPASCFGRYELLGELARGGMGVVYRARQAGLDRVVALKMVLGSGAGDSAQRFLQEARAAAALDHPNVVPIYDTGEIDGKPYFTMALIDGPNLKAHVEARLPVPVPEVVNLFAQIVAGVAHAHQADLIHRDLKPANVLIDRDGRARVTDFGLAKRLTTESQLTQSGQVVGTPHYMAPEQARDSKEVGKPADVYALGGILHFLLTGKPPFHAESYTDLLIKLVTDPPVPPREQRADVPDDLNELCLLCLAKDPAQRPADAVELAAALGPILDRYRPVSSPSTPALARPSASGTLKTAPPRRGAPSATDPDLSSTTPPVPTADGTPTRNVRRPLGARADGYAPVPEPEPAEPAKPSRLPLVLGGVAAVLAVVAVAALALSGKKSDETTKPGSPPPGPPVLPGGPPPFPPPFAPPGGPKELVDWPAVGRADFGLTFDLSAPGMQKAADGTLRLRAGASMVLTLKADRDCRVSVWGLDADGSFTKLFPNDDETDDKLAAGVERTIPGNKGYVLEVSATAAATGFDRVRVLATTGEPPAFPPGVKAGRYTVYAGPVEKLALAAAVRGVVVKKVGPARDEAVSEAEVRFRATK